jgi:hypothetical protein
MVTDRFDFIWNFDVLIIPEMPHNAKSIEIQNQIVSNPKMKISRLNGDRLETRTHKCESINLAHRRGKANCLQSFAEEKCPISDLSQFRTRFESQILKR